MWSKDYHLFDCIKQHMYFGHRIKTINSMRDPWTWHRNSLPNQGICCSNKVYKRAEGYLVLINMFTTYMTKPKYTGYIMTINWVQKRSVT